MSTTHHFVIEPRLGVGPVRFGMKKDEIAHAFTYVYRSFFKSAENRVRADHIEAVGLIVHYDDEGSVSYIEVTPPGHSEVTFELWGEDVTGVSLKRAFALLRARSDDFVSDYCGYAFPSLGLSLYVADAEKEDALVECIGLER